MIQKLQISSFDWVQNTCSEEFCCKKKKCCKKYKKKGEYCKKCPKK